MLYGITQGGAFKSIRTESTQVISQMDFDGIAVGGNLGKTLQDMYQILDWSLPELPTGKTQALIGHRRYPKHF